MRSFFTFLLVLTAMLTSGSMTVMAQGTLIERNTQNNYEVWKISDTEYRLVAINQNQAANFQNFNDNDFKSCTGKITVSGNFSNISGLQNNNFKTVDLKNLNYTGSSTGSFGMIKQYFQNVETLVMSDYQTAIGGSDFNDLSHLKNLTFGAGTKDIPSQIMNNKTNLESVTFSEGVETIGTSAFYGCSNLSSVTWPSTLKTIQEKAFMNCSSLASVNMTETSVNYIGKDAFNNCAVLTDVQLPASLQTIEQYAFYKAPITTITIPGKVMYIGLDAFGECQDLKTVIFADDEDLTDDDVMLIVSQAFDNSSNITDVYVNRHVIINCENMAFEDDKTTAHGQTGAVLAILHFPADQISHYVNQKHYLDYKTASDPKLYHEWLVEHYAQAGAAGVENGWFEFVNNGPIGDDDVPYPNSKFLRTYSFFARPYSLAYEDEQGNEQVIELTTARLVPEGVRAYIVNGIIKDGDFYHLQLERLMVIPPNTGVILYGETNSHDENDRPTLAMTAVGYQGTPLRRDYWNNEDENMKNYLMPTVVDLEGNQVEEVTVGPWETDETGSVAWRNFGMGRINKTDYKNKDVNDSQYVGFFRLKNSTIDAGKAYLRLAASEFADPAGGEVIVNPDPDYNKEYNSQGTSWDLEKSAKYWKKAIWTLKTDWSVRPDFESPLRSNFFEPDLQEDGMDNMVITLKKSGEFYTIQGVKVEEPSTPGVYINNGKKVVVK